MKKIVKKAITLVLLLCMLVSSVAAAHTTYAQAKSAAEYYADYYDDDYDDDDDDDYNYDDDDDDDDDWYDDDDDWYDDDDYVPEGKVGMKSCTASIDTNSYKYTGNAITPSPTVTGPDASTGVSRTLVQGTDYTVTYEDNKKIGVGRAIIQGAGDYVGYIVVKFGILPGKITGVKVTGKLYMENTVKFKAPSGADGYCVYRGASGSTPKFICRITDPNYRVFHDNVSVTAGKTYKYYLTPYVADKYPNETVSSNSSYTRPTTADEDDEYYDDDGYYSKNSTPYWYPYSYSCTSEKLKGIYEGEPSATASGKVTKSASSKLVPMYTGDAVTDYMVYLTNKKIVKSGSANTRVQKIYNWMVKNCTFTKDIKDYSKMKKMKKYYNYTSGAFKKKAKKYEAKIMKKVYAGTALCVGMGWHDADRGVDALAYHKGSCSYLTPMFNMLCMAQGVEAHIIDGNYVNRDKSKYYHNWSFVKIGKKFYWYDVPVACKNKSVKQLWYKKGTKYWKTCHSWTASVTKKYKTATFAK